MLTVTRSAPVTTRFVDMPTAIEVSRVRYAQALSRAAECKRLLAEAGLSTGDLDACEIETLVRLCEDYNNPTGWKRELEAIIANNW